MGLARDEVVKGTADELTAFEQLVRSLDDREWQAASRCAGWRVADVAAHVSGTMTDITTGRYDLLTAPDVTTRQTRERQGWTPDRLADELHGSAELGNKMMELFDDEAWNGPAPGDIPGTLGHGVLTIWYDTYVHAEDIRAAVGRPSERGPGLRGSVHYLAELLAEAGWGPATLALDGMEEVPVGAGGGRRVTGDPLAFVLAATGRADPSTVGLDETVNIYRQ